MYNQSRDAMESLAQGFGGIGQGVGNFLQAKMQKEQENEQHAALQQMFAQMHNTQPTVTPATHTPVAGAGSSMGPKGFTPDALGKIGPSGPLPGAPAGAPQPNSQSISGGSPEQVQPGIDVVPTMKMMQAMGLTPKEVYQEMMGMMTPHYEKVSQGEALVPFVHGRQTGPAIQPAGPKPVTLEGAINTLATPPGGGQPDAAQILALNQQVNSGKMAGQATATANAMQPFKDLDAARQEKTKITDEQRKNAQGAHDAAGAAQGKINAAKTDAIQAAQAFKNAGLSTRASFQKAYNDAKSSYVREITNLNNEKKKVDPNWRPIDPNSEFQKSMQGTEIDKDLDPQLGKPISGVYNGTRYRITQTA